MDRLPAAVFIFQVLLQRLTKLTVYMHNDTPFKTALADFSKRLIFVPFLGDF